MIKEKYFQHRNIINHDEIEDFLYALIGKCPQSEEYIFKNIKNFCYQSAPIKVATAEDLKKYSISSKSYQMHLVILNLETANNYCSALLYFINNNLDYKNKSFLDVYIEYNRIRSTKIFTDKVLDPGQIKLIKTFSDGSELLKLVDRQSYLNEGYQMGNCVYSYFGEISTIYSYRKNKKSIMTIEYKFGKIASCKLRFNKDVDFKEYPELCDFLLQMEYFSFLKNKAIRKKENLVENDKSLENRMCFMKIVWFVLSLILSFCFWKFG